MSTSREIGGWGNAPGQFNSPHAVTQMPDGRLVVVDFRGGAMHDYMTVKGQIAEERWEADPGRKSRIQVFDPDGNFIEQWDHLNPLTVAVYGDRLYASDNMSDLVVYDAHTMGRTRTPREKLAIYIHQMAVDPTRRHLHERPSTPNMRAKAAAPRDPATAAGRRTRRSGEDQVPVPVQVVGFVESHKRAGAQVDEQLGEIGGVGGVATGGEGPGETPKGRARFAR